MGSRARASLPIIFCSGSSPGSVIFNHQYREVTINTINRAIKTITLPSRTCDLP